MKNTIRTSLIGISLITAVVVGGWWIQQYLARSRASATAPTLSFSIEGPKVEPGDPFELYLAVNPNLTPFFSFDIAFSYDPTKVSLKEEKIIPLSTRNNGTVDVQLLSGPTSTHFDTANHTVRITGMRDTGASDPFNGRDIIKLVKIPFVMNAGQTLPLEFTWIDPDPAKITISDSFEKKNLNYTGEQPTPTKTPDEISAVDVPTSTPAPGVVQPTKAYNALTPVPTIMGSRGQDGATTKITEGKDLLYINSIASYQSPYRYEQTIKLEKGVYSIKIGAKIYVRKERGVVVAVLCNETTCGTKKKNDMMYVSPVFPVKTEFSEMPDSFTIPDNADGKLYTVRVFCEDGSECELDYISLEDAWGSERLKNNSFAETQTVSDPRTQPASWAIDTTAQVYGSIDPLFGNKGALMINNSAK